MKRLSVPAFPCCPVSTQPFGDLLLMWKSAQPQCSFILDFCFVNTSYVVGDMTWTSYLSPSPSRNYTGSLISFQPGYNIIPKAQCLFFSYCRWEMGGGIRRQNRGWPFSLSPAPSPLQEHGGCAKLCSHLGWLLRASSTQKPLPLQYVGVSCWESIAGTKAWGACPSALQGDVPLPPDPPGQLLKAIDFFFSGGNAEMPTMEQEHSISGSVSACLSGSTWLHCTALNMCDCLGLREGLRFSGTLATNFQRSCELFP